MNIHKSIWKDRKPIDDDNRKWYELQHVGEEKLYTEPVHCFICGKRIKGKLIPYGNFYVDEKCWNTNRYH